MRVTVVGLGLIGGSLALDLKKKGWAKTVVGVDASKENAELALKHNIVESVTTLKDAIPTSDLIILAAPVDVIDKELPSLLKDIPPRCVVTDMGSTKEKICGQVEENPKRSSYVAAHPMAGTENSGPQAAIYDLFEGKTAVICEKEKSSPHALKTVEDMFKVLNMRLVYMTPRHHDIHAAYVSHLSHISSFVLANTVLEKEKDTGAIFDLAGGGFESTVRLAKSSPAMWTPIFRQNQKIVSQALSDYIFELQEFRKAIDEGSDSKLTALMKKANAIRRVLKKMGKDK